MNSMESFFASLLAGSPPLALGSSMEKRGMIKVSYAWILLFRSLRSAKQHLRSRNLTTSLN